MYRILTENKNADQVKRTLCGLGLDLTVYYGEGDFAALTASPMVLKDMEPPGNSFHTNSAPDDRMGNNDYSPAQVESQQ